MNLKLIYDERPSEKFRRHRQFMADGCKKNAAIFILSLLFLLPFQNGKAQTSQNIDSVFVSVDLNKENYRALFSQIESQSSFLFAFQSSIIAQLPTLTIKEERISINELLNKVFANTNFTYQQVSNSIIINQKESEASNAENDTDAWGDKIGIIEGSVMDQENEALIGVSIMVKGTLRGTITNDKGHFALGVKKDDVLVLSFIGFKTQEIQVSKLEPLSISLENDFANLDEVMVIGYGTTTQRTSTGSVAKITAKDIENQPVTNVLQSLQGRTPGVFITQTSGYAGSQINIRIRGTNSIEGDNLPLYIINGVPYNANDLKEGVQNDHIIRGAQMASSPLNLINPSDIESIEILKDADATAIYGSRGANGVVLITTKTGQVGKTTLSVNVSSGISYVQNKVKLLDTPQYLNMLQTALDNANQSPSAFSNGIALTDFSPDAYTDWQEELLGNNANATDVSMSLSGGTSSTNFLVSAAYHSEETVIPGDFGYDKFSTNLKVNHSTLEDKLKLSSAILITTDKNKLPYFDMATYAMNTAPNHTIYNEDGSYYWSPTYFSDVNPLATLDRSVEDRSFNLIGSLNINYNILKGLNFKADLGYGRAQVQSEQKLPSTGMNWAYYNNYNLDLNASRMYTTSINYTSNLTVEPQLVYETKIWKGNLNALVGASWQQRKSEMPSYVNTSGYNSDNLIGVAGSATNVTMFNGSSEYKYASVFSRVNYNLMNRYILNLNFRRDGSSRFGTNHRYGNFGSVGAAWIFSNESFFSSINWLTFGKVRTSYGEVGSDAIGDYGYADTYTSGTYGNESALSPSRIANPNYRWEVTKKLEAALDLGFLNDRISTSFSFYRNSSGNQLVSSTLSSQTGFTSYQANLPALVINKGVEVSVKTTNIYRPNFQWETAFNISKNENELKKFPDIENSAYYNSFIVGRPLNSRFMYHYMGVDENGQSIIEDVNEDGRISSQLASTGLGDRKYYGSTDPEYYGGLQNTITYKGWSLDFLLQFVKQKGLKTMASNGIQPGYPYGVANYLVDDYNDYIAQGHIVSAQYSNQYYYYSASDAMLVDASYIKLRNLSVSYTFNTKTTDKIGIKDLKLYMLGQNLFTITKYKGWDPESQGIALPPLSTITFGLQCSF